MAVTDHPLVGLGYAGATSTRKFVRIAGDVVADESAEVADEVPVALVYNGRSHVVVMATPCDLEDLAAGFTRTEGIVDEPAQLERVEIVRASHGIEVQMEIPGWAADRLEARARGMVSRTGCGLCGVETISDLLRMPPEVSAALRVGAAALWRASAEMSHQQTINARTNAVHAAGWSTVDGAVRIVREDVGRHNALDKVLGALDRRGQPAAAGFLVVTSRASYEMVQKAATCGVELLAAVSRPTGLAIRFASAAGMTLVGLVRGTSANVYCGRERISSSAH
ncbi:MAG TPA: formate dehydrogenase accessory sulfurtransferase FdhD [Gemmatimonadaceae bacterium]|nr:formate dehydrogenase accessory sulfurtransferase FdhD [Gemmatimonadaceae bacterium]